MYLKVFNGLGNYFVKKANARKAGHPTTDLLYNALGQKFLHWADQWKVGREQLKELWRYSRSGRMTVAEAWQLFVPFFIEGTIWTVVGYGTLRFLYGGFGNLIPKPLPTAEVEHDEHEH